MNIIMNFVNILAMNRSEGLVQRKTALASAAATADETLGRVKPAGDDPDDSDDKESRLTLLEEVLLLGLKDREVSSTLHLFKFFYSTLSNLYIAFSWTDIFICYHYELLF